MIKKEEQEDFDDMAESEDSEDSGNNKKNEENKYNQGEWQDNENFNFVLFMDYHKDIFQSSNKRKSFQIFKKVAKFLKTRRPSQCRTHFQKMMNKFKTTSKIKKHYKQMFGYDKYEDAFRQVSKILTPLSIYKSSHKTESVSISVQTQPQFPFVYYPDQGCLDFFPTMMPGQIPPNQFPVPHQVFQHQIPKKEMQPE